MKIQGNLATYELSDLLQWLAQGNKTGLLTVSDGSLEYKLGFDHGRIDMSSSSDPQQRLDTHLHRRGVIDQTTLDRANRLRDATKMMSGQVLVTLGAVSEQQLGQALREKTEETLCELLTWDQGTFEFEGGDRPASTMVPINLEVTKLLLESMHRLDQSRGGPSEPWPAAPPAAPEPAVALAVEQPAARDDAATQAFEGLALAEVLDPESQPASAPRAGVMPSEGHAPTDPVPSYAAMQKGPGSLRRLLPFAAAALLGISAVLFYLANREPSAQASDVDSSGRPILFSQTVGPMPALTPLPEDTVPTPAPAAAPVPAGDEPESDETMRRRYERELADLRQELDQARKLAQAQPRVTAATPAPTAGADLPADSMMRAAVAPPETAAPAGVGPVPAEVGPASGAPTEAPTATASLPEPEPEPEPELPVSATPTRPPAEAATEPAPSEATTPLPRLVNPKLVSRPTPPYPTVALRYRREATIVVRVLVGPDGRVQEVERKGPKAGMGFDRAAEEAARASIWEAGTRAGEPTAMWAELRFEFKH